MTAQSTLITCPSATKFSDVYKFPKAVTTALPNGLAMLRISAVWQPRAFSIASGHRDGDVRIRALMARLVGMT